MQLLANTVELIYGGNVIKQGDQTPFGFKFRNEDGTTTNLQGATVTIKIANSKALILEKTATITTENVVEFALSSTDITGYGDMRLEFIVVYPDGKKELFPADGYQQIKISKNLDNVDSGEVATITVEQMKAEFQAQIDTFKADVNAAETTRQNNETTRQSNETTRQSNESTRQTNENSRTTSESTRQTNESTRQTNETNRTGAESTRQTNESTRQTNESTRQTNESTRQTNETTRQNNDSLRETNETTRQSNESTRQTNESTRQSNESTRQTNESTRQTNESTRQSNESTRQSNETARQTNTSTAITNAETATQNAQTVADNTRYVEPYNSLTQYHKNNIVSDNGSSFIAKQSTLGNAPIGGSTDLYWAMLAQRGIDGTGSVSTVNSKAPDVNGNVTITAGELGAEIVANKGVASGYAGLDSNAKIPLSQLPDTAKQQTYVVLDATARGSLTNLISGDKCYETSTGDSYIWNATSWLLLADADWANVSLEWTNINNKPATYPPSDHTHADLHTHTNKLYLDKFSEDASGNVLYNNQKIASEDEIIKQSIAPTGIQEGRLWLDTSDNVFQGTVFTNLQTQINNHEANVSNPHSVTAVQVGAIASTEKGAVSGVATLDASGNVPGSQLGNVDTQKVKDLEILYWMGV